MGTYEEGRKKGLVYLACLSGPTEVWQMDFMQLPPSHGQKYVSVMVCMFPHWTEASPVDRPVPLLRLKSGEKKMTVSQILPLLELIHCHPWR